MRGKQQREDDSDFSSPFNKNIASVGLVTVSASVVTLGVICVPFLRTFTGAPYVSSSSAARTAVRQMLSTTAKPHLVAGTRPRMIDLGSGSGEMVLDAANIGYHATGVEMNLWLVLASRLRTWRRGEYRATFKWGDMWKAKVADCDAVVLFGVPRMMVRIGEKLQRECRQGCIVCSNTFDIPGWKPTTVQSGVRFYRVSEQPNVSPSQTE